MKKLLAILLALTFIFAFAACGETEKEDGGNQTSTTGEVSHVPADVSVPGEGETSGETTEETTGETEPITDDEGNTVEPPASTTVDEPGGETATGASVATWSKAQILQYYNDATKKFKPAKPGTKKIVDTQMVGKITGSDQEKLDNLLDLNLFNKWHIESVVKSFFGEGTTDYSAEKGKNDDNVLASTLKESDVTKATITETGNLYVIDMYVINETNPKKSGKSALGRFTQDFQTSEEAEQSIKDYVGSIVTMNDISYKTKNVRIQAKIDKNTGLFTEVVHSYDFSVSIGEISIAFIIKVPDAAGSGRTVVTVSDFKW